MFDFTVGTMSHMPFAAPDPDNGFSAREFCCIPVDGKWKIHQFRNGSWVRVNTFMPDDATECSPAAEYIDGKWHLTFVAGGAVTRRMFRLYHICDLDGDSAPVELCPADSGYLQKNHLVWGARSGGFNIEGPLRNIRASFRDAEFLYRVTYDPFDPRRLIVSGQKFDGSLFSRVFYPWALKLENLVADGGVAYKAAFWRDRCFYCEKIGPGFEDRRIVEARSFVLEHLDVDEYMCITYDENSRRPEARLHEGQEDFE